MSPSITRIAHGTRPRVIFVAVRWKYIELGIILPRLIKSAGPGRLPSGIHAHAGIVVVRSSIMKIGIRSLSTIRIALGMRLIAIFADGPCGFTEVGRNLRVLTKSAFSSFPRSKFPVHSAASPSRFRPVFS